MAQVRSLLGQLKAEHESKMQEQDARHQRQLEELDARLRAHMAAAVPVAAPAAAGGGGASSLLERVAALELFVRGEAGIGGLALQIQALEEVISPTKEKQSGALATRVEALEAAVFDNH